MRNYVVVFLALAIGISCFFFFRTAGAPPVKAAASVGGPQPQFVRAAASGVSEKVSSFAAKPAFPGKKFADPARETVVFTSNNQAQTTSPEGAAHDADAAIAGGGILPMPTPALSIDGLNNTQNGEAFGLFFLPSDSIGDVGQNHYVQATNALVRIFDKSGAAVTPPFKMSSIFAPLGTLCSTRNDGEPVVLYDTLADRWLLSQYCQAFPPFRQMVAISQTGDPTGAWFLYEFVMPNNRLNDFSKFGVWPDGYYMSDDEFVGDEFRGTGVFAFDRQKMLSGDPTAGYIYFNIPSAGIVRLGNLLPADLDGYRPPNAGEPNIFAGYAATEYGAAQDALRLFNFHADFQNPANSTFTERPGSPLAVAAFDPTSPNGRADIAVPSPGEPLDSGSDRLMFRVAYRNFGLHESLVINQTVRLTPPEQQYRAGVRLYELRKTFDSPDYAVHEQATLSDPVSSLWMAGAAQDNQGNLAVEFSSANVAKAPSIEYAGKLASEPAGTFRSTGTLVPGTGVQAAFGFRWGDYTGMTVDPVDDCTFWITNQYFTAESQAESPFSWLTRIGKFAFNECTAPPRPAFNGTVTNAVTGLPIPGAQVTASVYRRDARADGAYGDMYVIPGTYNLTASAKGYASQVFNRTVSNSQILTQNFQLQPVPEVGSTGTSITAESCTPNQAPDPGESVTIDITLRNTGMASAQNLNAALAGGGGVLNPGPPQNYGTLPAGGAGVTRPFTFRVAPGVGCGGTVTLTLNFTDGATPVGAASIKLQVGVPKVAFRENFDRNRPQLPSGWTTSASGGQTVWTSSNGRSESSPNSLFSPDPNQVGVNEVTSPSFAIASMNGKVSFRNWYELETTFLRNRLYDGAVMEIQMGAGPWQDILAAGGAFETGGYDGTIDSCCQNPLMGRQGWSGRSGVNQVSEFITSRAKLPPSAAGQNVRLRWRVGTDVGTFREGMYIDDLVVTDGFTCACGSAAPIRAPFDFDGDGKTDLSVFNPSDTPGAPDFRVRNSSNNAVRNITWGAVGDRAAVADFDGDGRTDPAVFRPSSGDWYALRSSDATIIALHFGANGDLPVPADYDGDGKADIAVFRPVAGDWYYLRSSDNQFFGGHWGANGDVPVQADYDGDARTDLAVFRPADGGWYVLGSTQGFIAQHFGATGDRAVPGDYDGDGKSDFAVFRPGDRNWYLLRSSQGFTAVNFGNVTDTQLQADLDGDGVRDIAVYRASDRNWYYLKSSDGSLASGNFGAAGDVPVPSIYINP